MLIEQITYFIDIFFVCVFAGWVVVPGAKRHYKSELSEIK